MDKLIIFTDGSYRKKYNYCGYGVHFPNKEWKSYGNTFKIKPLTNQRAELYAIYSALKRAKKIIKRNKNYKEINIYSDSMYSINCLTKWWINWEKNDWISKDKKSVLNQDMIKPNLTIIKEIKDMNIKILFFHINSHTGKKDFNSLNNEIADKLANLKFNRHIKKDFINHDKK